MKNVYDILISKVKGLEIGMQHAKANELILSHIEKLERALEMAKEQRDEYLGLSDRTTDEYNDCKEMDKLQLDEILNEGV